MNLNKVWIYTNADRNICTKIEPFLQKREGMRRYDIYCSFYNPNTGKFEEVKGCELSPKIRSMKAAEKAAVEAIQKMAGMLVWFTATRAWSEKKAAENGIRLIWRAAYPTNTMD